jgi:DNA-binding HxlR family transcriptional regulator
MAAAAHDETRKRSDRQPNIPDPTRAAMDLLGRRWVLPLLYLLCKGDARFSELANAMPDLSRRVLTERLRELEHEGLIDRHVSTGAPTRITYAISARGAELHELFTELDVWANLA